MKKRRGAAFEVILAVRKAAALLDSGGAICYNFSMLTIEQIKQVFTKHGKKYGVKDAYLFGSYAKGEANEQSDVDILVGEDCINSYDDYYHLHEALEKDLERDVDLITMDGINPRFFNLIKDERISLYGA